MGRERVDSTGTAVSIELERSETISAYVVRLADGRVGGRAEFIEPAGDVAERVFFHTEVDPELEGRGLAGLLVRAALEDSIRDGLQVVPVCPLFVRHLTRHGEDFRAEGGRFRPLTRADIILVGQLTRGRS